MKRAHRKHGNCREWLAVCPRADVGRDRQLCDIELQSSHHPAEGLDDRRYFFEREVARARPHRAVDECLCMSACDERCFQPASFHWNGGEICWPYVGRSHPTYARGDVTFRLLFLLRLLSGPAAFALSAAVPLGLSYEGRIALATFVCVIVWWMAAPMPWPVAAFVLFSRFRR